MKQLNSFLLFVLFSAFAFSALAQGAYENLYIIGGPFNPHRGNNWMFQDIVTLEKDADHPDVFYYRGYIGYNTFGDEPGNFKILTSNNAWEGFHPDGESNQPIGAAQVNVSLKIRKGGADTKWEVPADRSADGYYVIKVDTQAETFIIESFTAAACPEIPVGIFIIGGPFIINDLNWGDVTDVVKMERDGINPYVFHYRGYMERNQWGNDPGNFKILVNKRDWGNELHPAGDDDIALTSFPAGETRAITNVTGGDKKWVLPEDGSGNGYWDFTVDAKNLTLKVNEFKQDLDYFSEMYVTGNALGGYTVSDPAVMAKISRGVYAWTGTVQSGDFKFLRRKDFFGGCYVAKTENEAVVLDLENEIAYEKNYTKFGGDYKFLIGEADAGKRVMITLNLNENKMMVAEADVSAVGSAENLPVSIFSDGRNVSVSGRAGENYTAQVFHLDGKRMMRHVFTGSTEMALSPGCYLVVLSDKAGKTAKMKVVIF